VTVQDGVQRTDSDDPAVHRDLVVVDPPLSGRDVANLQRAIQTRLDMRGINIPTPTHGKFTHATWVAGVEAGYFLGLLSTTYLATEKVDGQARGLSTQGAQAIIRNPDQRTPEQLTRATDRKGQVDRGPRYYDDLAKKVAPVVGSGPQAALAFAKAHLGVHESPAGSNWGHPVQDWIKLAGYTSAQPWCGALVNACLVSAGLPSGASWGIGYCPSVKVHAQNGTGGWSWHTEGQPGDVILYAGSDGVPEHQGLVLKRLGPDHYETLEGNTATGVAGQQSDGGIVAQRDRTSVPGFRIVGFARPNWG
jgi:hypothetical protein